MRIPNINLGKYQKSYNKTQKVIRTVTSQKQYIPKSVRQEAEKERKLQEYLNKQKEFNKEIQSQMDEVIQNLRAADFQNQIYFLYGIKIDKEKILEILKARKAK